MAKHIAGFANRADHIEVLHHRSIQPRQIDDVVPSVVQRRADQGIHAGIQTHAPHPVLFHHLAGAGQQHAGLGHQEAARLNR